MKIKCKSNSKLDIDPHILKSRDFGEEPIPLVVGKLYTVFSVFEFMDSVWYAVCDEFFNGYPSIYPYTLFELVDSRVSRHWHVSVNNINDAKPTLELSFPEWLDDPFFYNSLIDGESKSVQIFSDYKLLMDLEFGDSSISLSAEALDSAWVLCPSCHDAWECSNTVDELIKCVNCKEIVKNPRIVGN